MQHVNRSLDTEYCRLPRVMLIDHELSMEAEELTPSMKMAPNTIDRVYKANIEHLYHANGQGKAALPEMMQETVYIIPLRK